MDHEVLTTFESGFISGDSTCTVNQLVDIYSSFCKAIDDGKKVRAIFCDISKAFDRIWHKGLLYKLQTVGITGHLLQLFTDYLNNMKKDGSIASGLLTLERLKSWCASRFHTWPFTLSYLHK